MNHYTDPVLNCTTDDNYVIIIDLIVNLLQDELPDEGGDGSLDDAVVQDALLEILEEICVDDELSRRDEDSSTVSKRKSPASDLDNLVVKLPLAGDITLVGRQVFCAGSRCGSISFLTHWDPPAMSGHCAVHPNCFVTCPLVTGDQDALVKWIGSAFCFRSADDHGKSTPKGSYHRRNPPKK